MKTRLIGAILAIVLAVVGTVVLTGYVRSADARATNGAEMVSVYVVTEEIPAGTAAEEIGELIAEKKMPAVAAVPGRVTKLSALAGRVADTTLQPGEQLITSRWVNSAELAARGDVKVPDGMQSVTIALPVEHVVGGTIKAGDTVGVVITASMKPAGGTEEQPVSKQVFHKVLVTSVQAGTKTSPAKGEEGADAASEPVSSVMVTLARSTLDIEKLVWGQTFGAVWLTLETEEADETGSRIVDGNAVFE